MSIPPHPTRRAAPSDAEAKSSVPVFEEDRYFAQRVRQKLLTYERHRDQLEAEDRARIIEEIVQDTVALAREYSLNLIRQVRS